MQRIIISKKYMEGKHLILTSLQFLQSLLRSLYVGEKYLNNGKLEITFDGRKTLFYKLLRSIILFLNVS